MAAFGPHCIPHDHKYQSRGDFENRLGYEKAKPSSYRDNVTRKGSSVSDNDSTLVASSEGSSYFSEKPKKLDKYPDSLQPPQKPKKRRRLWPWLILIVLALVAIAVLTVLLVKRNGSAGGVVLANSSAVSTIIVITSQSLTTTTITEGGSTVTVITTQAPSTAIVTKSLEATTTTVSSQPTATPAAILGFDVWRFYNGDMMLVYESHGSIWTKQYQGSWNSPTLIASDAKPGTSVRLWGWVQTGYDNSFDNYDYYDVPFAWGLTLWSVYYVDTNSILQEKIMALDSSGWTRDYDRALPAMSGSWYAGILGSYGYEWKVSDTMYFETCAWGPLLQSESTAAGYIYFDAAGGGIQKLATSQTSWWTIADLPDPVAGSSKAITCAGRGDQIENLWLINENGQLEQWWLNATSADGSDSSLEWNRGTQYSGVIDSNTSLTTWSTPLSDIIFYQAPNNSIMYFNVLGEGNESSISSAGFVADAELGTHMTTSLGATSSPSLASYENATFDAFYVYFQNGTTLTKERMVPDPGTGVTVPGTPDAQIVISEAVVGLGSGCGHVMIVLCFGVALWLLL